MGWGCARSARRGCASGRGADLATLERFDVAESYQAFGTDVARMAHAAYAAELVGKLCAPRQVEAGVFDWLLAFLRLLDAEGASAERLRVFEIGLLGRLGFGPVVDTCAVCGGRNAAGADMGYRWDPDRGGAVCVGCARGGRPMPAPMRAALDSAGRDAARRRRARAAAGGRQPRLPRGAARDHHPSRLGSAQEHRIHRQDRAGRGAA